MWIFSKQGFFSITQHPKRRDNVQIRARSRTDLENLQRDFPCLRRSPIIETPDADYRWRIIVQRWKWELVGREMTEDIDYPNFKGRMATIPNQADKLGLLHDVWHLHHDYQQRKHPRRPHDDHPDFWDRRGTSMFDDEDHTFDEEHEPDQAAEPIAVKPAPTAPKRKRAAKKAAKKGKRHADKS